MADGNTLDVHFEFNSSEQKEQFKTALQGFVKEQQQTTTAGLSGEGEKLGFEPSTPASGPAPAGFLYANFIPKW